MVLSFRAYKVELKFYRPQFSCTNVDRPGRTLPRVRTVQRKKWLHVLKNSTGNALDHRNLLNTTINLNYI
jgi:hypothetical protein